MITILAGLHSNLIVAGITHLLVAPRDAFRFGESAGVSVLTEDPVEGQRRNRSPEDR